MHTATLMTRMECITIRQMKQKIHWSVSGKILKHPPLGINRRLSLNDHIVIKPMKGYVKWRHGNCSGSEPQGQYEVNEVIQYIVNRRETLHGRSLTYEILKEIDFKELKEGDIVINANDDMRIHSDPWNLGIGQIIEVIDNLVNVRWSDDSNIIHDKNEVMLLNKVLFT
jgi:hypothetical protein